MKRLISFFLILSVVASVAVIPVAAVDADMLYLKDFSYLDEMGQPLTEVCRDKEFTASFTVAGSDSITDSVDYVAALVCYNNGKLYDIAISENSVNKSEEIPESLSLTINDEVNRPEIALYIWDSLEEKNPLTSPAVFRSRENGLHYISVNGIVLPEFKKNIFTYHRSLIIGKDAIPPLFLLVPRDWTSGIVRQEENSAYSFNVSADGTDELSLYTVSTDIQIKESDCIYAGAKIYSTPSWLVKGEPGPDMASDLSIRATSSNWNGSSRRVYMKFRVPELPSGCSYSSAKLNFRIKSATGIPSARIVQYGNDWDDAKYEASNPPPTYMTDATVVSLENFSVAPNSSYTAYSVPLSAEAINAASGDDISLGIAFDLEEGMSTGDYHYIQTVGENTEEVKVLPYLTFEIEQGDSI